MGDEEKWTIRNVLVMALADGKVTVEEKEYIDQLRRKLGIDTEEFRELCRQVKQDRTRVKIPKDPGEAREAIRLLCEVASADGEVSGIERRWLERLGEFAGLTHSAIEGLLPTARDEGDEQQQTQLMTLVEELYQGFSGWDAARRLEQFAALGQFGRPAVIPLLRVLESYRVPDGAGSVVEMKIMAVDQLAALDDKRIVYYLAQHAGLIGSDEMTSPALRAAAAEAIGRIIGQPFSRDEAGVDATRQWWRSTGMVTYRDMIM